MTYRVTFSGNKKDAKAAIEKQSDENIKTQNQTAEQKAQILKIVDALPDGVLSGTVEDHNNGTVIVNVMSRSDYAAQVVAAAEVKTDTRTMPGAAAAGRPELARPAGTAAAPASAQPAATTAQPAK